jgi:23S rRNA pseudouridine2605 synthase
MKPIRINKFVAMATSTSRREAENLIVAGRIRINASKAELTDRVKPSDSVFFDGQKLEMPNQKTILIKLNKPTGYVCTHAAQGKDPSIFELLPPEYSKLKIVGRLDKDTSGLVLLTNDGDLAHQLMHPSFKKQKVYEAELSRDLSLNELEMISERGVDIGDERASQFKLKKLKTKVYEVILEEGRNRQIRKTFKALGIDVIKLKRLSLGEYDLEELSESEFAEV